MNGPWEDAEEVRAGIDSGEITWINVWWMCRRTFASRRSSTCQRMMPGRPGATSFRR
jgi:hypothetical protein